MAEKTKQIPTYRFRDTVRIELDVSDRSGVAEVGARFTTADGSRSIYLRADAEGATEATVAIEQEVTDALAPGEYRCEYVQLTDLRGNNTLVVRPDIGFRVEDVPGDHEGPQLRDWRYVTRGDPPSEAFGRPDAKRELVDEVRALARSIYAFAHDYEQRDPFRTEDIPSDMSSPEYEDLSRRYGALIDEMQDRYRSELRPEVVRVRGALAEQGIADAALDRAYERPRNFREAEDLSVRLFDMAGRLERSI